MKGEAWLIRILAIVFLIVSFMVVTMVEVPVQALWTVFFGVVNCITLWAISIWIMQSPSDPAEVKEVPPPKKSPFDSIDFASLMIDIAQYINKPLTYKQLTTLMLSIQAQNLYAQHVRLIKDDFWLINNQITTRGVDTSFHRYKGGIKDKMTLVRFPAYVPARIYDIIKDFDHEILDQFDTFPQVQRLKDKANQNGGLITDEMLSDFWKDMMLNG